jgi:uncharacterized protein YbcI
MAESGQLTGDQLAAIARELGSIKAESYGKGPTEAKAYSCDDFVFCVLKGSITAVERTLLDHGDDELVRQVRSRYQARMAGHYIGAVERITGRKALTYQSQVLFDPDYIVEIFVLAPAD